MTFGEKVIRFNSELKFTGTLPQGIRVMNPFIDNKCALECSREFYRKYYNDNNSRNIILGINPGRFGAGITGVPFTDPVKLREKCHISIPECPNAREPSSDFIYMVIQAYGGVTEFYQSWYINSICPLGFIRRNDKGKWVNYNYYDTRTLENCALPFILKTIPEQINLGINTQHCICLGTGKNMAFLSKLNSQYHYFNNIIALEHPRYVMQYKSGKINFYIDKYIQVLAMIERNKS